MTLTIVVNAILALLLAITVIAPLAASSRRPGRRVRPHPERAAGRMLVPGPPRIMVGVRERGRAGPSRDI